MASRYHWLNTGGNTTWSAAATFTNYNVAVPAGARLVRVLAKEVHLAGQTTVIGWPGPSPVGLKLTVALTGGTYEKTIYSRTGHVYQDMVALYDNSTTQRVYSCNYSAQDDTCGFNHECSYGGPGKQVNTVRFTWSVQGNPALTAPAGGSLQIVFMALYYL